MRISELHIKRFGVWSDLQLKLSGSPISVFYGPNEAGKSTLMRFIRSMLYGYQPEDELSGGPHPTPLQCLGSIRVDEDGRDIHLERRTERGTRGRVQLSGSAGLRAEHVIDSWIGGTSEEVYRHVYAIGLQELQELATLNGEDVARHIYSLSLGPEGRRILGAQASLESRQKSLLDETHASGDLVRLIQQLDAVDKELNQLDGSSATYHELVQDRGQFEGELGNLQRRKSVLKDNLRGRQFLDRVFQPWNRQHAIQRELDALAGLESLPENAVELYDAAERDQQSAQAERNAKQEEARGIEGEIHRLAFDERLEDCRCSIIGLVDRVPEMRSIEEDVQRSHQQGESLRRQLDTITNETPEVVEFTAAFGDNEAALARLLEAQSAAQQLKQRQSSRSRLVRSYRRLGKRQQNLQVAQQPVQRSLNGQTLESTREHVRRRLDQLEELETLQQEEQALCRLAESLDEQYRHLAVSRELPPYFYGVMWFAGIAGLILFALGLLGVFNGFVNGGSTVWIAGAVYMFVGLFGGGVAWTLKEQFEPRQWNSSQLTRRIREVDDELAVVRRQIDGILKTDLGRTVLMSRNEAPRPDETQELSVKDVLAEARNRMLELAEYEKQQGVLDRMNRRLGQLRDRLRSEQSTLNEARLKWVELLRALNLKDSLQLKDALTLFPRLARFLDRRLALKQLELDTRQFTRMRENYRRQVETVAHRVDGRAVHVTDALATVELLERRMRSIDDAHQRKQSLAVQVRRLRDEAAVIETRVTELGRRQQSLLSAASAHNRNELQQKCQSRSRIVELRAKLREVTQELNEAAASEPELAIVESDLVQFDVQANRREIESIRKELDQIDRESQQSHEQVGILKQRITDLQNDRRAISLRYDRDRLAQEVHQRVEDWTTLQLASNNIDRIRENVERQGQPQLLKHASQYLSRLTCGRYHNIWAPLGEKNLAIDDDQGEALRVQHLSNGTREQLFLAIRLAMVQSFADEGVRLPMVLDDVFVNFDQSRTEAAVETLIDYSRQGQQVLMFTCHLHLAQMFESRGIEPVWLPRHAPLVERQAG